MFQDLQIHHAPLAGMLVTSRERGRPEQAYALTYGGARSDI